VINDIIVANLSKSFNGKNIIPDLSIQVPQGAKISITGKSGSGKSTLINILMGFVMPDSGNVNLLGNDLNELNINKIRSDISWVPQELLVDINNVKNLLLLPFCFHKNKRSKPTLESIRIALNRFGLDEDILNSDTGEISGGERQRIFLAASSLLNRKIYFLDEPTSSLDYDTKMKVMDYFLDQCKSTVVSVTHDDEWMKKSDLIVNMDNNSFESK
jgi:ABC-type bacteriocin/lantibiotic exporter with double-glycine peptidase domain